MLVYPSTLHFIIIMKIIAEQINYQRPQKSSLKFLNDLALFTCSNNFTFLLGIVENRVINENVKNDLLTNKMITGLSKKKNSVWSSVAN